MNKWNLKRVVALIGIVILVAMYIMLLVCALLQTANWQKYFTICMGLTLIIPLFLWIFTFCYDRLKISKKPEDGEIEISHKIGKR